MIGGRGGGEGTEGRRGARMYKEQGGEVGGVRGKKYGTE